ncbi:MAG: chemotaxis protein CheW [Rhodospirillaceae bacterium BRH_c57]|nr:MAG: chemotaxis protein CheW [Rhodospirillaceae bacterium BRH_c57]
MSDLTTASQGQLATLGNRGIAAQEEQVFVTVYVEKQLFGIPVERVQDILIPEKIARIPLAPPEVAGSINLRGRIVTVIDVRTRLGLRKKPTAKGGKSIMCVTVEQGSELYSLMVDSVGNVLNLAIKLIEPNPSTLDPRWRGISAGVVRLEGELLIVLDVDSFLNFGDQMMAAAGGRA